MNIHKLFVFSDKYENKISESFVEAVEIGALIRNIDVKIFEAVISKSSRKAPVHDAFSGGDKASPAEKVSEDRPIIPADKRLPQADLRPGIELGVQLASIVLKPYRYFIPGVVNGFQKLN